MDAELLSVFGEPMRIASIDPGVTTGLCFYAPEFETLGRRQLGPDDHYSELWQILWEFDPDVVICESFQNMSDLRQSDTTKPLEYIGIVKFFQERHGSQLGFQVAAQGKEFWDDDKLKAVALYEKGRPHSNDATRHFLYYWTFTLKRNEYLRLLRSFEQQQQ